MSVPLDQMGSLPGQGGPGSGAQLAGPEAQQMGVKAIENMLDVIYGEEWENLITELSESEDVAETVGRIVATLYIVQEAMAMAAGKELPQEIALDVGEQMVEEMFLILDTQDLFRAEDEDAEQRLMAEAMMYAAKYYRMHLESEGRFDEQQAMQLGQDIRDGVYDPGGPGGGQGAGMPPPGAGPSAGPGGGQGRGMPPAGPGAMAGPSAGPPAGPAPGQGGGMPGGPEGLLERARLAARGAR